MTQKMIKDSHQQATPNEHSKQALQAGFASASSSKFNLLTHVGSAKAKTSHSANQQ